MWSQFKPKHVLAHLTLIYQACVRMHVSWVEALREYSEHLLLGEEAEASRSIANTLWRVWTMFTRSAITPPEVNGFGWNLGNSEYVVRSCPWQILGAIRAEAAAGTRAEILFFCPLNNALFHRLPVGQISRNLHKKMRFRVRMWGFGKHLWKFARKGSFSQNLHFCLIKVNYFRLPESISPKWLQILESHDRLDRLWNVDFPLTPSEWAQWFPWPVARAHGEQFFPQNTLLRRP